MATSVDVLGIQIDLHRLVLAVGVVLSFIGIGIHFDSQITPELMGLLVVTCLWFLVGAIGDVRDTRAYLISLGFLLTAFGGLGYLRGEQSLIAYTFLLGGPIVVITEAYGIDSSSTVD
ncbi:hypothetical protein [Haladaptatus sp. CMAA 1911]|uniref:hypothetical protein n=1 Tax=unclassified Haladaptatus TaxID=2622732 RepID=UPI003754C53D